MWRFALAVVIPLGLALGPRAETDVYGAPNVGVLFNVGVSFNQHAANVINNTPCISAQVQAGTPYLASLTIVSIAPPPSNSVGFTLSAAGLNLSGTGRLKTNFYGGGTITVQTSSDGDCPIVGTYKIKYYSLF